jgi:glycosyltransferase involved in cell wall biosynthesis
MGKKACLFVGYYPTNRGGAEYQAYLLAQKLREQFETFYISVGEAKDECIVDNGMKIYTLRSPCFLCFKNVFFLLKSRILGILKREQPNVIYQRVAFSGTGIAAKYCQVSKCKMVWHIASEGDLMPYPYKGGRGRFVKCIESKCRDYGIRNADFIIGQAAYQEDLLRRRFGRACDLIVGNFHPVPSEQILKDGPLNVVWVANMKPLKQPEVFIRLAGMLCHRHDVKFALIGKPASGRYQTKLEKAMEGLSNLAYRGEQSIDEVNRTLARAHVFVNTSLYEGFPNTFVQAWLRHVPVVSLNVDPDNLLETKGLGFHSRSLEGLARDTERLIDDRDLRESMGNRAHEYALRHHSAGPNIARIAALIANVH